MSFEPQQPIRRASVYAADCSEDFCARGNFAALVSSPSGCLKPYGLRHLFLRCRSSKLFQPVSKCAHKKSVQMCVCPLRATQICVILPLVTRQSERKYITRRGFRSNGHPPTPRLRRVKTRKGPSYAKATEGKQEERSRQMNKITQQARKASHDKTPCLSDTAILDPLPAKAKRVPMTRPLRVVPVEDGWLEPASCRMETRGHQA